MDWTKDINTLFEPLRELARHGQDKPMQLVLAEGTPEITDAQYDSWDGGTTYCTLVIYVPVHIFVAIENELDALEKRILERAQKISRADPHQHVQRVMVQPAFAPGQRVVAPQETSFWIPGHFRVFISHLSADKVRAANLKSRLTLFAISSFIAHEDIEPTKEWLGEIERALFSMDALIAILSDKFHESKWTDQEVGVALGRGMAVLPLRAGIDPYGLMGKFQGIPAAGRSVRVVSDAIVGTLLNNPRTRHRFTSCLVEQLLASRSVLEANKKLDALERAMDITSEDIARIQEQSTSNTVLSDDAPLMKRVNALLAKHGADPVGATAYPSTFPDDEIPF